MSGGGRSPFARLLALELSDAAEVYHGVASSAALRDGAYWLETVFAAGIATLGLVLDSPAVIIGAMLISPLMGPILASGLALAAGDVGLAARALAKLALSAAVAVGFATALVWLLPFREMTGEIAARTRPNTLDLVIALFSGAVGSIAACKSIRGVATSIPGVAIAVALMPPLCVAGYGVGVAATVDRAEGMAVLRGGGLLFLTNLVAITFSAMLVFLLFRIPAAAQQTARAPLPRGTRWFGSLPGRLLLVGALILAITMPLTRSFDALKNELAQRRRQTQLREQVTRLWESSFARGGDGRTRSYLEHFSAAEKDGRLAVHLRVFTSSAYSAEERGAFVAALAGALRRPASSIDLSLVEIPTSRYEVAARKKPEEPAPEPPTFEESLAAVESRVESAVAALELPPPAELVDYALTSRPGAAALEVAYLSERQLSDDARLLIARQLRQLVAGDLNVSLVYIPRTTTVTFPRRGAALSAEASSSVTSLAALLAGHASLTAALAAGPKDALGEQRIGAVAGAIESAGVAKERVAAARAEVPIDGCVVIGVSRRQ